MAVLTGVRNHVSDPGSDRIRIHEFHEWKRSGQKV